MVSNIQSTAERLRKIKQLTQKLGWFMGQIQGFLLSTFFSVFCYRNCWMIFIKIKRTRKIFINKRKVTSLRNTKFPPLTSILAFQWQQKMCLNFSKRWKELQKITCLCIHIFLKEKKSCIFKRIAQKIILRRFLSISASLNEKIFGQDSFRNLVWCFFNNEVKLPRL